MKRRILLVASALALVGLLALPIWLRSVHRSSAEPPPKEPQTVAVPVPVWRGETIAADGGRIEVRLRPLYGDPSRQRHDGEALRARYGLGEGEPYRLELSGGELDARLTAGEVVDGDGAALVALARVLRAGDEVDKGADKEPGKKLGQSAGGVAKPVGPVETRGETADPLRTLLTAVSPSGGGARAVLLWGRAPGEGAKLRLPLGKTGEPAASVALEREERLCGDLERYVARLEPPADEGDPAAESAPAPNPAPAHDD